MKTIAQLNTRSIQLANSAKKLGENIHLHMVDIIAHFKEHGDASAATVLFNAFGTSVRKDAVAKWFIIYGGMNYNAASADRATGKVIEAKFTRNKDVPFANIDLDAAAAESPWDLVPMPEFKAFDLQKAIAQVIKKAEKALADTEHASEHKVDTAKLAVLQSL